MKENQTKEKKINLKLMLGGIAAVTVIALAVVLGIQMFGEMTTPAKTVEGYLTSLYAETRIRNMQEYLVDDIKDMCYNEYTLYGQSLMYMQDLQRQKAELVGEPFTISVKVDAEASASASALKSAASTYGANQLRDVSFTATFEGPDGTADFGGIARVAQIGGKWYLTEYNLNLGLK
ncbi:MAG: hypothetical protein IKU27_09360 [Clostridia bacterium]|nr:hypothetical protein [Clostridia bacterium]MBR5285237.1 hypothetical protein [Clostridia bacterium]